MPDDLSTPPTDPAQSAPGRWRMAEHWPELVTALTEQSIDSVTLLLRGLDLLERKGRLTSAEHKVLALPAERLKHVGMSAQQIVRFQSGRVRQSHEKIDLAYLLECVLQERRNELALLGLTVWRKFQQVDVLIDPTLGFSLAQAMLDWSMRFGHRIDLRLDLAPGEPPRARLRMKTHGEHPPIQSQVFEDGIHWLLLRQIAATDGAVELERSVAEQGVLLCATFGRTLPPPAPQAPADEQAADEAAIDQDSRFKSVTGAHVLLVSPDPATTNEAATIIERLGILLERCQDKAQAASALARQRPDLLVLDTLALPPDELQAVNELLAREQPGLPRVEIVPSGTTPSQDETLQRVTRESLQQSLGSTVMFMLARVM